VDRTSGVSSGVSFGRRNRMCSVVNEFRGVFQIGLAHDVVTVKTRFASCVPKSSSPRALQFPREPSALRRTASSRASEDLSSGLSCPTSRNHNGHIKRTNSYAAEQRVNRRRGSAGAFHE